MGVDITVSRGRVHDHQKWYDIALSRLWPWKARLDHYAEPDGIEASSVNTVTSGRTLNRTGR
jgi:hypothetical protein